MFNRSYFTIGQYDGKSHITLCSSCIKPKANVIGIFKEVLVRTFINMFFCIVIMSEISGDKI
jgi:hypothetical protein